MRKRLPSLFSLQVFEAAARHGTFTRAARELHLTQGAVSRQIRQLEDWTGRTLFRRNGPQVQITQAGRALLERLSTPLDALHSAIYADEASQPPTLHIATLASVARAILLPRIATFTQANSQLQITIHTDYALTTLPPHAPTVAVRYGHPPSADLHHDLLFADRLVPVASPTFAERIGRSPKEWPPGAMLAHIGQDWSVWLQAADATTIEPSGLAFNDAGLLLDAAECGAGIALMRLTLAWDALRSRRLTCISPVSVVAPRNHYLLCRAESLQLRSVAAFRQWILGEAEVWRARLAAFDAVGSMADREIASVAARLCPGSQGT